MGTDSLQDRHPPLSRHGRAKQALKIVNKTIPSILKSNSRARRGIDAAELIVDPPPSSEASTDAACTESKARRARPEEHEVSAKDDHPAHRSDDEPASPPSPPRISLRVTDTLTAARDLHLQSSSALPQRHRSRRPPRIAVLNMASPLRAGGGVLSGATSQEESLCARSTLYASLRDEFYRLPDVGGVFTPDVLVFARGDRELGAKEGSGRGQGGDDVDDEAKDAERGRGEDGDVAGVDGARGFMLEQRDWFFVDVVTAAALRFPDIEGEGDERRYAEERDREMTGRKMAAVMRMLRSRGVGRVVLGAWGCGAYGNPVGEVARAWRKTLLGGRPRGKARGEGWDGLEVVFAIKDARMADAFAKAFGPGLVMEDADDDAGRVVFGG